ncbi:MAG TPA: serine/threonine-protein kinase [Kofleriaceae bacterium]|nr:serine/threonine-protein kinase [Kofleriaceae bacterium]
MEDDEARPTEAMAVPPVHEEPVGPGIDEPGSFELVAGTDVGGYVIDGELGRGGMGVVYSARHPVIGKRAAIKVLKPSLSNNPATIERFIQEARSVNAIGHPNIVDIFDFDMLPDGRRYLVMDLLEGESLRKRVKRGPLPVAEAVMVIDEIASALDAAHAKGFIHRDLKPDNVFLVANPGRYDVKLLDFGLAKLTPNNAMVMDRAYRTATGAQLGTPDYMSPEQLRGDKNIDHRTDIYALGVVAFEIITGNRPRRFSDGSFDLTGTPSAVVGAVPSVPAELAQLVETLLAAERELRPSLVAVRAVIKRVKPALPSVSMVGLDLAKLAMAQGSSLDVPSLQMRASAVGAKPVLPTPAAGNPTVHGRPPTGSPEYQGRSPTGPPENQVRSPTGPEQARPRAPSPPPSLVHSLNAANSGLRPPGSIIPTTKMGVAPPPVTQHGGPKVRPQVRKSSSTIWWIVAAVLAIAAGIVIAIVIVT